jgi:hypothetical protein
LIRIRVDLENYGWLQAVKFRAGYVRRVRERFRRRGLVPAAVVAFRVADRQPSEMVIYVGECFDSWMRTWLEPITFPEDWVTVELLPNVTDLIGEMRSFYGDFALTPDTVDRFVGIYGDILPCEVIKRPNLREAVDYLCRWRARPTTLSATNVVVDGPYPRADFSFRHLDGTFIPEGGYPRGLVKGFDIHIPR